MKGLKLALQGKIVLTAIFWCIPLLTFPPSLFVRWGMPAPEPMLFVRLLGVAYFALLVGYYYGIGTIKTGGDITPVLSMGIVSNGLAFLTIALYGFGGRFSAWGGGARAFMWISALGALTMAANLLWFRLRVSRTAL